MAGQVQLDGACRLTAVRVGKGAAQVCVGQYSAAVVAQADTRIIQLWHRHHRLHVDQRIVALTGRVRLHLTAGHGAATMAHSRMIHAAHARWLHLTVVHLAVLWRFVLHGRLGRMRAVIAMAHVFHAQLGTRVKLGHRRAKSLANRQRAASVAAAVHRLGEQAVGLLAAIRRDDHVDRFGHRQAQFVDLDRLD